MKKVFLMALMALVALAVQAKDDRVTLTSGDGKAILESGKTATVKFDYSKTIAEGQPLKQYLANRGDKVVKDWPGVAQTALNRFVTYFNKKNKKGVQIVDGDKADLSIKVVVDKLDFGLTGVSVVFGGFGSAGGAEITGKMIVSDAKTGKQLSEYELFEVRGMGDYTEGKRLGACYENVVKMVLKASK